MRGNYAWLFFFFFSGAIQIIQGPQDVVASFGDTVTISCEYTGTRDLPNWRIGGIDYSAVDLPPGHQYISLPPGHQYTRGGLKVNLQDVQPLRNNTKYSCYFYEFLNSCGDFSRIESSPGDLIIHRSELSIFNLPNSGNVHVAQIFLNFAFRHQGHIDLKEE